MPSIRFETTKNLVLKQMLEDEKDDITDEDVELLENFIVDSVENESQQQVGSLPTEEEFRAIQEALFKNKKPEPEEQKQDEQEDSQIDEDQDDEESIASEDSDSDATQTAEELDRIHERASKRQRRQ